jgi:hypothetical protein
MTIWAWVGVGSAALGISGLVVGVALGRVLATVAEAASELLDNEYFASAPPARAP